MNDKQAEPTGSAFLFDIAKLGEKEKLFNLLILGSYPYTSVVQGSGIRVIGGRKFPIGKTVGRNTSEPIGNLVKPNGDADPVDTRGRPPCTGSDNGDALCNIPG